MMKVKLFNYDDVPVYTDPITLALVALFVVLGPMGVAHGLGMSTVLLGSVLLHELGHAIAAKRIGYKVNEVTLMIFGGLTHIDQGGDMKETPDQEIVVSVAGPAVNIALAAVFGVLVFVLPINIVPAYILGMMEFAVTVNCMLGIFNLLPMFPLDGGHIGRAVLSKKHGLVKGTRSGERY